MCGTAADQTVQLAHRPISRNKRASCPMIWRVSPRPPSNPIARQPATFAVRVAPREAGGGEDAVTKPLAA